MIIINESFKLLSGNILLYKKKSISSCLDVMLRSVLKIRWKNDESLVSLLLLVIRR